MLQLGKPEKNEELRPLPEGQLEDVQVGDAPNKTTKIQVTLSTDLKDNLVRARVVVGEEVDNVEASKRELELGEEIREEAQLRDYALKERVATRYNKKVMRITFLKNNLALLRNDIGIPKHGKGKLAVDWKDPFKIAEVLGKNYYKAAILQGADLARSWHACELKKYYS
ncbi:hypothetical protein PIB30_062437 [Stylosanthes scabra]|uniref:Reverse transcriptase domain-containing protein n=1 Tax=Stylosanthes scabra TaxID=79078 RepID=A0ABU6ZJW2_9FABA|nr:hypothetical protein [Stylosanthes scabra]